MLFQAIIKERQSDSVLRIERFKFASAPVHSNLNKDTLHIKHFGQPNTSARYAALDAAIQPIISNPQVPVSLCWDSLILALRNAPNNYAEFTLFSLLLSRRKWTAVIYEEFHFLNRQQRIDSDLFGPNGEDDRIPINIVHTPPHVDWYLISID